jgi:hypothetical protein
MKRWSPIFPLLTALVLLAACSANHGSHSRQTTHSNGPQTPRPLEITFAVSPQHLAPGGTVTLISEVKQDGKPLDATVEFEVWRSGDPHKRLKAVKQQTGVYAASESGLRSGNYSLIVHVTAPGIHQMTSGGFTVGGKESHEHEHDGAVAMHIQPPETVKAGSESLMTAHVMLSGKPLAGAEVKFEYWTESGNHVYKEAAETEQGEYIARITFPKPGIWHVKLHVENGKIHDHQEITLTVR